MDQTWGNWKQGLQLEKCETLPWVWEGEWGRRAAASPVASGGNVDRPPNLVSCSSKNRLDGFHGVCGGFIGLRLKTNWKDSQKTIHLLKRWGLHCGWLWKSLVSCGPYSFTAHTHSCHHLSPRARLVLLGAFRMYWACRALVPGIRLMSIKLCI